VYQPIVAAQLYVWLQHYQSRGKYLSDHFNLVFTAVKEAGYNRMEGWLISIATPEEAGLMLRRLVDRDMRFCSVYHGGAYHERELAEKAYRETDQWGQFVPWIGCALLNVNPDPIGREKTDEELAIQGEYLTRLGKSMRERGVHLTIHNHDVEIRNGARELHANCANTDPEYVSLCLDLDWIQRGGGDPIAMLKEYLPRVESLHLRSAVNGVWSEALGEGDLDYHEVAAILREVEYEGFLIVELAYESALLQDLAAQEEGVAFRRIQENLKRSREYVREVFGV